MLSSLYDTGENVYYIHKILIIIQWKRPDTLRPSKDELAPLFGTYNARVSSYNCIFTMVLSQCFLFIGLFPITSVIIGKRR